MEIDTNWMEAERAIKIVQALADGVDPYTGERYPSSSPYQQADTVRALHLALAGLTKLRRSTSRKSGPGRAWTDEEEQKLLHALDAKVDVEPIARAQDSLGRPEGLGIAGTDYEVAYAYDPFGRFGAVSVAGQAAQYRYVEGSDLLAGWTNSIPNTGLTKSYEPNRDLLTEVHNQAGGTVSKFAYQNDALGRRTERVDSYSGVVTNRFAYNARSEVTNAVMGADSFAWAYDPIGNRQHYAENETVLTYLVNQLNQYTNIANGVTHAPSYDDDGNMISYSGWTYQWNGENRLMLASNVGTVVSYAYDYMGRRIRKTVNGVETEFLYDGWNLVQETIETNVTRYVWGLDLSQTLQGAGGVGGLLCVIVNGDPYYPAYDANGNVTEYVNSSGAVVAHYEYDTFGNTIAQSGPLADTFAHRFSTKYLDAETGLYYYGYRYYSPELGRWPSRDPLGDVSFIRNHIRNDLFATPAHHRAYAQFLRDGTDGLYRFVNNQTHSSVDLLGLACTVWFDCSLSSSMEVGRCDTMCNYICTETRRVPSFGGGLLCDDLPASISMPDSVVVNGSFLCDFTLGLCGTRGECDSTISSKKIFTDSGLLDRNCSRAACALGCEQIYNVALLGCGITGIGDIRIPTPCVRAAQFARRICVDGCNAWCQQP
ncbi:MAG: hypothetical protein K9N51_13730 [Candidatus Pacebacteria bacterium]|nr:hypothetical protein [Candidatus Paceibacterota bacterium]